MTGLEATFYDGDSSYAYRSSATWAAFLASRPGFEQHFCAGTCHTLPVGSFYIEPWQPPFKVPVGTPLFHYTSAQGLLGIVGSGTLYATEATGLNDAAEIVLGQRKVRELIDALPSSELKSEMELAAGYVHDANGPDASDVFVLAASLQHDDANQWRLYADDGRGYCVELDASMRLTVLSRGKSSKPASAANGRHVFQCELLTNTGYVSAWSRVLYDEARIQEAFAHLVAWAERAHAEAKGAAFPDPDSGDPSPAQEFGYELSRATAFLTRCIKAPGFAGETEARVLVSFLWGDEHAHFRATTRGVVRHFALGAAAESDIDVTIDRKIPINLPIRSVTLGPGLRYELAAPAARSLLFRQAYEIQVIQSKVRLR